MPDTPLMSERYGEFEISTSHGSSVVRYGTLWRCNWRGGGLLSLLARVKTDVYIELWCLKEERFVNYPGV
jgi:hypothetical protein